MDDADSGQSGARASQRKRRSWQEDTARGRDGNAVFKKQVPVRLSKDWGEGGKVSSSDDDTKMITGSAVARKRSDSTDDADGPARAPKAPAKTEAPIVHMGTDPFEDMGLSSSSSDGPGKKKKKKKWEPPAGTPFAEKASEAKKLSVHEVKVFAAEKEWGEGMGLSSSDDSDGPGQARRDSGGRWQGLPDKQLEPKRGADGPPAAGQRRTARQTLSSSSDSSSDELEWAEDAKDARKQSFTAGGVKDRRQQRVVDEGEPEAAAKAKAKARLSNQRGSALLKTDAASGGLCAGQRVQNFRFGVFAILHVSDFLLRFACIVIYWRSHPINDTEHRCADSSSASSTQEQKCGPDMSAVVFLIIMQGVGACLSIYITFHDSDVQLYVNQTTARRNPACRRLVVFAVAFIFGVCQVIQVKRAWARQLHHAEVLADDDDDDDGPRPARGKKEEPPIAPSFAGAERALPVALLTGVPFLVVNSEAFVTAVWIWSGNYALEKWFLRLATVVCLSTVSFAVIEIDVVVSTYVTQRYHVNPSIRSTRAGRFQFLFPVVHIAFRMFEVFLRVVTITTFVVIGKPLFGENGQLIVYLLIGSDLIAGLIILYVHSPQEEFMSVHSLVAVGMLMADLVHFVDQPNFSAPARHISRDMQKLRAVCLLILTVICVGFYVRFYCVDGEPDSPIDKAHWQYQMKLNLALVIVYYVLRYIRPIRCGGHDLHTASQAGNARRVKKLLLGDKSGNCLDLNALTKDGTEMTPAHFAAENGHVDVLELLLDAGANLNVANANGDTCLHLAARAKQVDACKFLVNSGVDRFLRNVKGEDAVSLVVGERARSGTDHKMHEVQDILQSEEQHQQARGVKEKHYSVAATPIAGLQLKALFPTAADDDTPSPRAMQSVSSLVISRAAGSLSRRLLARNDRHSGGGVQLGALRSIGELGKGGFGKVIEVELPEDARSMWHSESKPKRFALKLQLKSGNQRQAYSEVLALQRADHPFIVRLERAFQTPKFFALLLELCPTDLNRVLCEENAEARCPGLAPPLAAKYMGQILLALVHLHTQKEPIVYRDIKPENILISSQDDAKLTDFGLAKIVTSSDRMTMCGTMGYFPPELMTNDDAGGDVDSDDEGPAPQQKSKDAFKMDAYSFGVTLQVTLLGEDGAKKREIRKKGPMMLPLNLDEAENTQLLEKRRDEGRLSEEAFNMMVAHLLPVEPDKRYRLDAPEVIKHAFFGKELGSTDLMATLLGAGYAEQLGRANSWGLSNPFG